MPESQSALNKGQANVQADGTCTWTILDPTGVMTYLKPDYNTTRPAQKGDIYSADPNGGPIQGREPGANGPYECTPKPTGRTVCWTPQGDAAIATIMPYGGGAF